MVFNKIKTFDSLLFIRSEGQVWTLDVRREHAMPAADGVPWQNWATTRPGFVFLTRDGLTRADPTGKGSAAVPLDPPLIPAGGWAVQASGLGLSPDGRWLLYSAVDFVESDLVQIQGLF